MIRYPNALEELEEAIQKQAKAGSKRRSIAPFYSFSLNGYVESTPILPPEKKKHSLLPGAM